MQDDSILVECPICKARGKGQVLGRVYAGGSVEIRRFHHFNTYIKLKVSEYQLVCDCGYTVSVSGTILTKMAEGDSSYSPQSNGKIGQLA